MQVLEEMQGGLRAGQIILDTTTGEPAQTAALGAAIGRAGRSLSRRADLRFERADPPRRSDGHRGRRPRKRLKPVPICGA